MPADAAKLRAWWAHRQGLDGSLKGAKPAEVLERSGWARSVAGAGPYLTLFSRAGISREAADAAVAAVEIHELPAVRNCTYVLPACDFALGLRAGQRFWAAGDMRAALKLGVTEKEIGKLCEAVLKALEGGPLSPDDIREAAGKPCRSLGDEGKKKGITTTLPLALGKLQAEGEIRRVPTDGRMDRQRYRYMLWRPNPLRHFKLSDEDVAVELARRFFKWAGPVSIGRFQTFAGLSGKAAKAAIEALKLAPAGGHDRLMFAEDRAKFEAFQVPENRQYVLVSSLDAVTMLPADFKDLLDPVDHAREVFLENDYRAAGTLASPPSHVILDRGRVVGLWEFDADSGTIAWMSFIKANQDLAQAVAQTEVYVGEQLGDARQMSLDSPKSRAPRVAALRKQAASA